MAKVLFTHSYFYKMDAKQWQNQTPFLPLGTIYAAGLLRENSHEVSLFDVGLKDGPNEIKEVLAKKEPDYLVIYDDGFNYLTKMCLTTMREACFEMIQYGKKHNCKVIVSSSDATDHAEKYLNKGADYIIYGEGEETLLELVTFLKGEDVRLKDARHKTNVISSGVEKSAHNKKEGILLRQLADQNDNANIDVTSSGVESLGKIDGLIFKEEERAIKTKPRKVLRNLDSLPLPAWDLVNVESYRQVWRNSKQEFTLNLATTRGCPYKCNWCAKPIYGQRYNSHSPKRIVEMIAFLSKEYQVNRFWMCDDIFGLKPNWVQEFRDELKARDLKIKYYIQSRADLLLKEDTIDALAESGLEEVWIGAESGSQKILDAMDKGTTIEQIERSTKLLQEKGVKVAFFIQYGYLGETKEDIKKTISMIKELKPHNIGVSVSYPLPETPFYEKVKHQLKEKANWKDSDDLAMMFKGTFNQNYYRKLQRYTHKIFRKNQGLNYLKRGKVLTNLRAIILLLYYIPSAVVDKWVLNSMENTQ